MQHTDGAADALAADMRISCLGTRVGRAHRLVTRIFEQALRPYGVTLPQLELLATLTSVAAPIRPGELAELTAVERSTMSRNLGVLQDKGWVATTGTSPTGRSMAVTITAAGTRLLASARPAWDSAQEQVAAALGPDSPATFDGWITRLVAPEDPPG
jgi:DNA-binding MarR family transcriptional regulator